MKRITSIVLSLTLCLLVFFPVTAYAKQYDLSGTDLHIHVDDTQWYVFTRENIENNPELEELGISYEKVYDVLYNNYAYMDAILIYEDGTYLEMFVRKKDMDTKVANLSNYDRENVLEFTTELANKVGSTNYSVFESQYKYARLEYADASLGYHVAEYATIVNKDSYTLTFQSKTPFTQEQYNEMDTLARSVTFDVDPSLKEETSTSAGTDIAVRTAIGAVTGGVIGGAVALINKKRKKKNESNQEPPADPPEGSNQQ